MSGQNSKFNVFCRSVKIKKDIKLFKKECKMTLQLTERINEKISENLWIYFQHGYFLITTCVIKILST